MRKPRKLQKDEDSNSVFPNIFRAYEEERGVYDVREVLFIHQFHILSNICLRKIRNSDNSLLKLCTE